MLADRLKALEEDGLLCPVLCSTLGLPCFVTADAIQRTLLLLTRLQRAVRHCDEQQLDITLERLLQHCLPDVAAFYAHVRASFATPHEAIRAAYFRPEEFFCGTHEEALLYNISVEDALCNSACALRSAGSEGNKSTDATVERVELADAAFSILYEVGEDAFTCRSAETLTVPDILSNAVPGRMCVRHVAACLEIAASCQDLTWSRLPATWTADTALLPRLVHLWPAESLLEFVSPALNRTCTDAIDVTLQNTACARASRRSNAWVCQCLQATVHNALHAFHGARPIGCVVESAAAIVGEGESARNPRQQQRQQQQQQEMAVHRRRRPRTFELCRMEKTVACMAKLGVDFNATDDLG